MPFSWLATDKNFVVRVFGTLTVKKTLTHGDVRLTEKQDASAVALREGRGPIQLWLGSNVAVDMFEQVSLINYSQMSSALIPHMQGLNIHVSFVILGSQSQRCIVVYDNSIH